MKKIILPKRKYIFYLLIIAVLTLFHMMRTMSSQEIIEEAGHFTKASPKVAIFQHLNTIERYHYFSQKAREEKSKRNLFAIKKPPEAIKPVVIHELPEEEEEIAPSLLNNPLDDFVLLGVFISPEISSALLQKKSQTYHVIRGQIVEERFRVTEIDSNQLELSDSQTNQTQIYVLNQEVAQ